MNTLKTCCAIAGFALATVAQAENLPDPTKPPVGYAQGEVVGVGPVLQSILISPTRRVAVISGKTLHVGESFDDAKVVSISDNEVVLKSGGGKQVLRLYPILRKTAADNRPGGKLDGPGQQK